jgi:hypothetical protein
VVAFASSRERMHSVQVVVDEEPLVFSCIPVELTTDWPKEAFVERYFPETSANCRRNLTRGDGYG